MTSKYDRLRTNIPAIYQAQVNRYISGLLKAWAEGDEGVAQAIAETKAQLFVATASGEYLDRLGSNVGVARPSSLGINDVNFRDLVPALSFAPKQLRDAIQKLLEIWYKPEAVYANMVSTAAEPYSLTDGDTISLILDRKTFSTFTFSFAVSDFLDITNATAAEVANAVNKQAINAGIRASVYVDHILGKSYVRLRTTTPGPTGEIQIAGGTAQNILQFPQIRATTQNIGTQWKVATVVGNTVRMEYTGVGPSPNLTAVETGDLMILSGAFSAAIRGSYILTDVVINAFVDGSPGRQFTGNYVEFANAQALTEIKTQTGKYDAAFYYPKRNDVNSYPRPAVLYEINHKEIVVILPATASIIGRNEKGSAHIHPNTELKVLTMENQAGSGFAAGDNITGMNAMYLDTGIGQYVEGETVLGGFSGSTATVFKIIDNATGGTILGVTNVLGGFIVGETVTGLSSGATRQFRTLINAVAFTANLDSEMTPNGRYGVQDVLGIYFNNIGLLGRTDMRLSYSLTAFQVGEALSTANALHLVAPWVGNFVVGDVVTGGTSGAFATVINVVRDKYDGHTVLQLGPIGGGPHIPGETVTGSISLAFAMAERAVVASGATAQVEEVRAFHRENSVLSIQSQVGTFSDGEIIVGAVSSARAVLGDLVSAVATLGSIEDAQSYLSPYIYDIAAALTASEYAVGTNELIAAGTNRTTVLTAALPTDFPAGPGYVMFEYGTSQEEGPIRYIGRPTNSSIIIDPAFVFQKEHQVGASVRFLRSLEPTAPRSDGGDYAAYVTGLAIARAVLQDFINSSVAAGVTVRFIIVYPEYAFQCYNTNQAI